MFSFRVGNNDPRREFIEGKYICKYKNSCDTEYFVSDFLQDKLNKYEYVDNIYYYLVWILDETVVVKMFVEPELFEKALHVQQILAEYDLGCKIVDVWRNGLENFIVSQYGGNSLEDEYDFDKSEEIPAEVHVIIQKLLDLGLRVDDFHSGNFVRDLDGKIRIIDYESVSKIPP